MTEGRLFQLFVNELKAVGFPVDKVSGGDIQLAFAKCDTVRDAIYMLHGVAERRRKQKEMNKH